MNAPNDIPISEHWIPVKTPHPLDIVMEAWLQNWCAQRLRWCFNEMPLELAEQLIECGDTEPAATRCQRAAWLLNMRKSEFEEWLR